LTPPPLVCAGRGPARGSAKRRSEPMGPALCHTAGGVEGGLAGGLVSWRRPRNCHRARRHARGCPTTRASAPVQASPSAFAYKPGSPNVRLLHRGSVAGAARTQPPVASVTWVAGAGECATPPPPLPRTGAVDGSWKLARGAAVSVMGSLALGVLGEGCAPRWWSGAWLSRERGRTSGLSPGSAAPPQSRRGGGQRQTASGGSKEPRAHRGGAGAPLNAPRLLGARGAGQWYVLSSVVACAHGHAPSGRTRGVCVCHSIDERGEGKLGVARQAAFNVAAAGAKQAAGK